MNQPATNQPATVTSSPPSATPTAAKPASAGRLVVLLGLLGLATAALAYDNLVAKPGLEAAVTKVDDYAKERNSKGAKESGPITPDDIHQAIGMQPTFVEKHPDKHYMVEYYCWWGRLPVIDLRTGNRRHFLAIVYVGDKAMRFSSHHKNEIPTDEALPIQDVKPSEGDEPVPLAAADAPDAPAAAAPGDAPAPKEE
jgi:hypothetical protein